VLCVGESMSKMTVKDLMIHYLSYFFDAGCSVFTKIGYAAKILGRNLSLITENLVQNNLVTRTKNEGTEEEREKSKDRN
jgi:predicted transcriptional regulator